MLSGMAILILKYILTQVVLFHFLEDMVNIRKNKLSSLNLFTLKSDILLDTSVQKRCKRRLVSKAKSKKFIKNLDEMEEYSSQKTVHAMKSKLRNKKRRRKISRISESDEEEVKENENVKTGGVSINSITESQRKLISSSSRNIDPRQLNSPKHRHKSKFSKNSKKKKRTGVNAIKLKPIKEKKGVKNGTFRAEDQSDTPATEYETNSSRVMGRKKSKLPSIQSRLESSFAPIKISEFDIPVEEEIESEE